MAGNKIKLRGKDRIFNILNYIYLFFCFIIVAFPLINVISQSFSSPASVVAGRVLLWPVEPSLVGYKQLMKNKLMLTGFLNSLFYMMIGTAISVSITICAAYALSRKVLKGRTVIMWIFTFTMLFNGGIIPTYLLVRRLGLIDTRWALLLPNALIVWNMIIAKTFFATTIPESLYDAAEIDGSSDLRTFVSIVLPLSPPIIAVMTLFYAVGIWNSYFDALLYINKAHLQPLQLVLRNTLISSQLAGVLAAARSEDQSEIMAITEVMKYSIIVAASVPVIILYPFIQKYFIKGIMIGSIKG